MFPEAIDRFLRLGRTAGGGNNDEMRGKGAGGEVLVDQALADAEADSAGAVNVSTNQGGKQPGRQLTECFSERRTYLLPPVTNTNKVSWAGTASQGAGAMVGETREQTAERGQRREDGSRRSTNY